MCNLLFKHQFHKLLCGRTHILEPLPEWNNGKSHIFEVLNHLHSAPAVEGNLTDIETLSEAFNEFFDIISVNDGNNYIFDEAAVKEIGWIWKTEVCEDVNLPSNLLRKANQRLAGLVKGITSMELSIVDESDAGADIPDIHA